MAVDDAVKNADIWELAQNPVFRHLQQKLNERTDERDRLRYAYQKPLPCLTTARLMSITSRMGYLEIVRALGPDIFDDVPDRFNIRELIAQEREVQKQLENI